MNKTNSKIINMGTIKGQEWIGKTVLLYCKIPDRLHEVKITSAYGWDGIEMENSVGRRFTVNQYGQQGDLSFEDVDIMELN